MRSNRNSEQLLLHPPVQDAGFLKLLADRGETGLRIELHRLRLRIQHGARLSLLPCSFDGGVEQSAADATASPLPQNGHPADFRVVPSPNNSRRTDDYATCLRNKVHGAIIIIVEFELGGNALLVLKHLRSDREGTFPIGG